MDGSNRRMKSDDNRESGFLGNLLFFFPLSLPLSFYYSIFMREETRKTVFRWKGLKIL